MMTEERERGRERERDRETERQTEERGRGSGEMAIYVSSQAYFELLLLVNKSSDHTLHVHSLSVTLNVNEVAFRDGVGFR